MLQNPTVEEHGMALLAEHLSRMRQPGALDRPKPSIQFCVSIAFWKQIRNSELSWKRSIQFSCSVVANSWYPMNRSTPGLPVHLQLPESTQTHVHWASDAIQPSHPLSSPSPPALNLSQNHGFSNESALRIRWPKNWSFSFKVSPSNAHPGLLSFRMDWFDLLELQGTPKSLLQHHSSKASILRCSAFFIVQLSHPTIAEYIFSSSHETFTKIVYYMALNIM